MSFLLKCEQRLDANKEILYPIKHYLELLKNFLKVDFFCFTYKDRVAWSSSDWYNNIYNIRLSIDVMDRLLFITISKVYGTNDIDEIPIYFSKTILEDDSTGKIAYKLYSINLLKDMKIILLSDLPVTIKKVSDW
jgi:hypothetical protein